MKSLRITTLLFCLVLCGCAAKKPVAGSANTFDSDTYLTLVTTDTLIQGTKKDLADGAFPVNTAPNVKAALNTLIQYYDAADLAYQTYHAAALSGTDTPAQQTAVINTMINVKAQTAALTSVKAVK